LKQQSQLKLQQTLYHIYPEITITALLNHLQVSTILFKISAAH